MQTKEELEPAESEPEKSTDDADEPVQAEEQRLRTGEVFDLVGVPLS